MDSRMFCVRCLIEVDGGGYSNLVLKNRAPKSGLNARDLAFASAVFYGTLERQTTLDFLLGPYLKKGIKGLDTEVRAVLRAGLYQALYLDSVPISAAVNESVRICRALKKSSAAGLVNAVLRKAAEGGLAPIEAIKDTKKRLSVQYSLCGEMVDLLCEQYGEKAESIMAAMFGRTVTAARVNTLKIDRETLLALLREEGIEAEAAPIDHAVVLRSGDYLASRALKDGLMRIQSLAAQCAALALDAKAGMSVLDLCAAPGGKTLTSAQQMNGQGTIVAMDRYDSRLKLIEKQAEREGVTIVKTVCGDACTYDTEMRFDRVLCDVPCSGYGEIASKPELRQKPPRTDNPLFETQRAILERGAALLKEGGRLVYSTCTIDRRENEAVVEAFLKVHGEFGLVRVLGCGLPKADESGYLRFVPNDRDPEGFFVAVLERKETQA